MEGGETKVDMHEIENERTVNKTLRKADRQSKAETVKAEKRRANK